MEQPPAAQGHALALVRRLKAESDHFRQVLSAIRREKIVANRWFTFAGVGVAPALLLTTLDYPSAEWVGKGAAGVLSTGSWLAVLFGYAFSWERQLQTIEDALPKVTAILLSSEHAYSRLAESPTEPVVAETTRLAEDLRRKLEDVRLEVDRAAIPVAPWRSLVVQQDVMARHNIECLDCQRTWPVGRNRFNAAQAKKFLKTTGSGSGSTDAACATCGLPKDTSPPERK